MNLLTLQYYSYCISCQPLDDLEMLSDKWSLFLHCITNSDVDSYLLDWNELKTLHGNIERLYNRLNTVVMKELKDE